MIREKEQKEETKQPEIELPPAIEEKPISEILPADFFDDKVQGAVAMGKKAKDAQKELKRSNIRAWMKSRKEEKQIKDLEKEEAESMCNLRIFSEYRAKEIWRGRYLRTGREQYCLLDPIWVVFCYSVDA